MALVKGISIIRAEGTSRKMKYLLNFHQNDNLCQDLFAAQVVPFRKKDLKAASLSFN